MGILICVCCEASEDRCDRCGKGYRLSPDQTMYHPRWRRYRLKGGIVTKPDTSVSAAVKYAESLKWPDK